MSKVYDSSLTRVRPVFEKLKEPIRPSDWLIPMLVKCGNDAARRMLPRIEACINESGDISTIIFEAKIPAPRDYLRWLASHPEELDQKALLRVKSLKTRLQRERLFSPNVGERNEAIRLAEALIDRPDLPKRSWAILEGETHVDCLIQIGGFTLAIEGKRTESVSESTSAFKARNQISRNLDVLRNQAMNRGNDLFGVMLICERPQDLPHPPKFARANQPGIDALRKAWPHLEATEQEMLFRDHFFGTTTWRDVCDATGIDYSSLPDKKQIR